jgi:hypothetical protein
MRKTLMPWIFVALAVTSAVIPSPSLIAGDWSWLNVSHLWKGTPVDVHMAESCEQCGHEGCIERTPVEDCVVGKKKEFKTSVRYQYVSIPEVRYRWQMKCITKEIPCDTCKTVCEINDVDHPYQVEHWEKQPTACGELHCKTCETKIEKLPAVTGCKEEPAKTTIKVHYWSCVKVPYTVYRQVRQEVCVKQPRDEKVEVPVTRYVCEHCGGLGCGFCKRHD